MGRTEWDKPQMAVGLPWLAATSLGSVPLGSHQVSLPVVTSSSISL